MLMRGGGQEARNNNAKNAKSAKSFSYVFVLFAFFAVHFSFFMAYQKHWSPAFKGVREDNICVHLRSSVDMPFRTIHGCPDLAIQIRTMT
jgi:hypothetical protein